MNNEQESFIARERENIIVATNNANKSIDEIKVNDVNNRIKVKKKNPFIKILIIILCLIVAISLTYYGVKYINKKMDEITSTSTTTLKNDDSVKTYINNINRVRKLKNDKEIMFLFPANTNNLVVSIDIQTFSLISSTYGTYNIMSDKISILYDNELKDYYFTKNGLKNDEELIIDDSEFKYYTSADEIILINASSEFQNAYIVTSSNVTSDTFLEDDESITIGDKKFSKKGDDLLYNGITYIHS